MEHRLQRTDRSPRTAKRAIFVGYSYLNAWYPGRSIAIVSIVYQWSGGQGNRDRQPRKVCVASGDPTSPIRREGKGACFPLSRYGVNDSTPIERAEEIGEDNTFTIRRNIELHYTLNKKRRGRRISIGSFDVTFPADNPGLFSFLTLFNKADPLIEPGTQNRGRTHRF